MKTKIKNYFMNNFGLLIIRQYPFFKKIRIPPKKIPGELYTEFTLDGRINVTRYYFNSINYDKSTPVYTNEQVFELMNKAKNRQKGGYGKTDLFLYKALDKYPIKGKTVVVMGSTYPWYEAVVLNFGGKCTVIEYNKIISKASNIKIFTPEEYDYNPIKFDVGFSISSFEHDGLGRYGDRINPNGDLEAMEKMKKIIKPGGILFLAVPIGKDSIVWNAHRIYGRIRFPLLINGWKLLDSYGFENNLFDNEYSKMHGVQPIFVLRNNG